MAYIFLSLYYIGYFPPQLEALDYNALTKQINEYQLLKHCEPFFTTTKFEKEGILWSSISSKISIPLFSIQLTSQLLIYLIVYSFLHSGVRFHTARICIWTNEMNTTPLSIIFKICSLFPFHSFAISKF